uniref:Zinc finger MYM-type protein 1-like n=1 Tax=Kalanchoe fedtschenkoi TaxID=63787 RepID=A0A7N0RAE9_KALFE
MESLNKQVSDMTRFYKSRLTYSLKCLRFLLCQGLIFRGDDESESSENMGNFHELLAWLDEFNDDVKQIVFKNAQGSYQMTCGGIQKDLINSCAKETTKLIIEEVKDDFFGILVDESSDASGEEYLAVCLRYIDRKGRLIERFLGIVHVEDTTAASLKSAIQSLLMGHSLSMSKIRGQSYNGASNMKDLLNNALQRKDQDIIDAMTLVSPTKKQLQNLRSDGWEDFLSRVTSFCVKHDIEVPDMDGYYFPPGRARRFFKKVKNIHRFQVEMFLSVIDLQLQELTNRFDEVNMELLMCMSSLNPANSFAAFDKQRILRLAEFYPNEFSTVDLMKLDFQLQVYINDLSKDVRFQQVRDLGGLSCMLVETNKHKIHREVYLLLKLVLILPMATASVERVFSAMSFVKSKLRDSMGDQQLNDSLVTFIEKDMFLQVSDESVLRRFQDMKTRRNNF